MLKIELFFCFIFIKFRWIYNWARHVHVSISSAIAVGCANESRSGAWSHSLWFASGFESSTMARPEIRTNIHRYQTVEPESRFDFKGNFHFLLISIDKNTQQSRETNDSKSFTFIFCSHLICSIRLLLKK